MTNEIANEARMIINQTMDRTANADRALGYTLHNATHLRLAALDFGSGQAQRAAKMAVTFARQAGQKYQGMQTWRGMICQHVDRIEEIGEADVARMRSDYQHLKMEHGDFRQLQGKARKSCEQTHALLADEAPDKLSEAVKATNALDARQDYRDDEEID